MSISPCCGGHVDRSSSSGQTTEAESCSRVHRGRVVSTWYRGRGRLLPRRREHIAIERALEIGTPTSDYTPPQGIELTVYASCVRARQSVLELKKRFRGYSLTLPLGTAVTYKVLCDWPTRFIERSLTLDLPFDHDSATNMLLCRIASILSTSTTLRSCPERYESLLVPKWSVRWPTMKFIQQSVLTKWTPISAADRLLFVRI